MSAANPPAEAQESSGTGTEPGAPPPDGRWRRVVLAAALGALALLVALSLAGQGAEAAATQGHFGFASVMPALVTLVLVFITREVVTSLFMGIVTGAIVSGRWNLIDAFLLPSIGSESYAVILLVYLWALGGLIGLWTRTGGALHFAEWAGQRVVRGPRSAKAFAWMMGIVFHQGGTISTILAGTTVRPVTDRQRVSHEEVSYIVDSTASPVAGIIPLNAWPLYIGGLVAGTTPLFQTEQEAISFFFRAVPFNFYAILAVLMTLLFALEVLPWEGRRMRAARDRARSTGLLNAPGSRPLASDELSELRVPTDYRPGLVDFLLPLGVLIGVALTGVVPGLLAGDLSAINVPIAEAFGLSVLVAFLLALVKGMKVQEAVDGFIDGCKGVTIGAIILALALTLGNVSGELGTATYIIEATADIIVAGLLPAILLLICMGIAFSTGTSWGTYAVVFPIAMPLAYAVNADPLFVTICFAAVTGGSIFGDQCSPISDTTILSALATGGDLMDHVLTQLPLALTAAALAGVAYTVLGFLVV